MIFAGRVGISVSGKSEVAGGRINDEDRLSGDLLGTVDHGEMVLHRWTWTDLRRRLTDRDGRWKPLSANGTTLFAPQTVAVTRYRYRGNTIPKPWTSLNHTPTAEAMESAVR